MLKLYNSLTRRKEIFKPIGKTVGIYTCGPSVYQPAHIGNFRTFIFEDVLVRYLSSRGYQTKRIMNLTDVEDKAIEAARKEGKSLKELTGQYSRTFFEDLKTINLLPADAFPKATGTIPEMVKIIKRLLEKGYAYRGEDGTLYYKISRFKDFGKLSRLKLKAGKKRMKRDEWGSLKADFALWKSYEKKDRDVFWKTELGKGRPGWHVECTAMSTKYLGARFDIQAGGVDNIFPHHECTIAQNFGAFGKNPAKYWLHCRHLIVNGKKMSKSLGNYYTISDLLKKGHDPMTIRYLLLSKPYRRKLNFTFTGLEEAGRKLQKIRDEIRRLKGSSGADDAGYVAENAVKKFEAAMDDSLNTGQALEVLEDLAERTGMLEPDGKSSKRILGAFREFDPVLGLRLFGNSKPKNKREGARAPARTISSPLPS